MHTIRLSLLMTLICSSFLIGCATTQFVAVPSKEIDPDSAIIILRRPSALIAKFNNPMVFDNGKKIGEISDGGELKWSRDEGALNLEIIYLDLWGNHGFPAADTKTVIEVKKNTVTSFTYKFGGVIQPSSIKLDGDESSNVYFTSIPPGAVVYAGSDLNNMKPTSIITPHTMSRTPGSSFWGAEYYKMTLNGYKDSPIVFKNNFYGDRIVHYDFVNPANPVPPKAELPVRKVSTPQTLIAPAIPQ